MPPVSCYIQPQKYCTWEAAREEAELVVFSAIDELFSKTDIDPRAIDILVVNCSGFSPTPGFPDMIVRKYKMRSDIRNIHLSGMGCSAGIISIELVKNLLQTIPQGAQALVVSTETITPNFYVGNERAMLLPYCLFRMGGAAVLLSTSPVKARFRLKFIIRTLTAADDNSYNCIHQMEDNNGNKGLDLSIDLTAVAARTLKSNISTLAPLVLPPSEKLLFALSFISQKLLKRRVKLYVPDFRTAFEHFCVHAGGRAVIDEVQRSLGLSDEHVEPSRMTLHRFGNTSSSSVWYELAYIEAKGRMRRANRVWMIGFGSGFKFGCLGWKKEKKKKLPVGSLILDDSEENTGSLPLTPTDARRSTPPRTSGVAAKARARQRPHARVRRPFSPVARNPLSAIPALFFRPLIASHCARCCSAPRLAVASAIDVHGSPHDGHPPSSLRVRPPSASRTKPP
ncbi:hypothetical protein PR202_ga17255 [Eleusine coracana subsp. coracana]|uniref:very-long-chain 3-oxoacyl-CoA synthase n=1 Tax=Eleusine coracana subsp. coracana TaxID=191504 RepID=A0AAV5CPX5_ELECO|nr:hypothetical protein PR202_ga17255 [Eleusine coracana subsp. coracana]